MEFNSFYIIMYRTTKKYDIITLTHSATAARNIYARELENYSSKTTKPDEALMLVEVLIDCVEEYEIEKLKSFVGKGATDDKGLNVMLDSILNKSGSVCNVLEYFEHNTK